MTVFRNFLITIMGMALLNMLMLSFSFAGNSNVSKSKAHLQLTNKVNQQYIVVFHDSVVTPEKTAQGLANKHGFVLRASYQHALKGFAAKLTDNVLAKVKAHAAVAYVEQDLHAQISQLIPVGVKRIAADQFSLAFKYKTDKPVDADIAILDTGIDLDHPDLYVFRAVDCTKGPSCIKGGDGNDGNGHGTHVAGTAAALDNDSHVVGVAPGARLWAVKVLRNDGTGFFSDIIQGVDYVTSNSAQIDVVNMSLGGIGLLDSLRTAITKSVNSGVVYVVAAGNSGMDEYGIDGIFGTNDDYLPASYPEVLTVSAMGDTDGLSGGLGANTSRGTVDDSFADFSNFSASVVSYNPVSSSGAAIDLAAPGVDILSTWNDGGTKSISGTSMASPHVAGAVALEVARLQVDNPNAISNGDGVALVRQLLIDAGKTQSEWGTQTNDPASYPEVLVYLGDGMSDDIGGSDESDEGIAVPPPISTVVSITNPVNYLEYNVSDDITFVGTASEVVVVDGTDTVVDISADLQWHSDIDGAIGLGSSFTISNLSINTHIITASLTDSNNNVVSSSISIEVIDPYVVVNVINVQEISYKLVGRGNKNLEITIQLSETLFNAEVTIELFKNDDSHASGTGSTGSNGSIAFILRNAKAGFYRTEITQISLQDYVWDGLTPDNLFVK